jgi:hypothetical protein
MHRTSAFRRHSTTRTTVTVAEAGARQWQSSDTSPSDEIRGESCSCFKNLHQDNDLDGQFRFRWTHFFLVLRLQPE